VSRVHISERWKHPSLRTIVVGEEAIGVQYCSILSSFHQASHEPGSSVAKNYVKPMPTGKLQLALVASSIPSSAPHFPAPKIALRGATLVRYARIRRGECIKMWSRIL
jgi:hypothetical protein